MKISTFLLLAALAILVGACASTPPSSDVRKIGDNQYEVSAKTRVVGSDSVLVSDWNAKAKETCGGDFEVISRHFNSQTQGYSTMTGIISCK